MQKQQEKQKPFLTEETNACEFAKFELDLLLVMNENGSDRFLRGEVSNEFKDIEREPVFDYVKDGRRMKNSIMSRMVEEITQLNWRKSYLRTHLHQSEVNRAVLGSSSVAQVQMSTRRQSGLELPSEYFGYLKDNETRLYKYQIRKEKNELKVLKGYCVMSRYCMRKSNRCTDREGLEIINREYDQLIKAKSEDQEKSDLDRQMKILSALRNYREWKLLFAGVMKSVGIRVR